MTDSPETNKNYWRSRDNQKLFVEEFGRAMGIEPGEYDKWYKVTYEDFHNHGGAWIKRYYDNSLYLLMKTLYPEHKWIAYKFEMPKKPEPGEPVKEKIDWYLLLLPLICQVPRRFAFLPSLMSISIHI